jgi:membrane protease YdiL (CAAX protease family)
MDIKPSNPPAVTPVLIPVPLPFDRVRLFELALVLFISLGGALFGTFYYYFAGYKAGGMSPVATSVYMIMTEAAGLGVLGYVVFRRGQKFSDLGLTFNLKQVLQGFGLALVAYGAFMVCYGVSYYAFPEAIAATIVTQTRMAQAFGFNLAAWFFMFLNPVFEELIVRAFTITEVKALTGSTFFAVLVSVLIQSSYHLNQGEVVTCCYALMFFIFSIFYVRTVKILPVIIAHCVFDVGALLMAALK